MYVYIHGVSGVGFYSLQLISSHSAVTLLLIIVCPTRCYKLTLFLCNLKFLIEVRKNTRGACETFI
jgi:hypothetical protein